MKHLKLGRDRRAKSPSIMERLELRRLLSAGSLDPTFGRGGTVTHDPLLTQDNAAAGGGSAVAIQNDGKVVVAGGTYLTRYLPDGRTDQTFGTDGVVLAGATDLALQSDGKIIAMLSRADRSSSIAVVRRYNTDGSLDPTFNGGGVATITDSSLFSGESVAVDPSTGKIVVAGSASDDGTNVHMEFARLTPSGALDVTFGGSGLVSVDLTPGPNSTASSVLVQPDGRIVAGGAAGSSADFAVLRLTIVGALDPTFGDGGSKRVDFDGQDDGISAIAFGPDGTIVAAGSATITHTLPDYLGFSNTTQDFALARFTSAGQPDSSFGAGAGKVVTSDNPTAGSAGAGWSGVGVLADGEIVTAGAEFVTFNVTLVEGRYQADGTFRPDASNYRDFSGDIEAYSDLALGADGSIARVGGLDFQYVTQFGPDAPSGLLPPAFVTHEGPGGSWQEIGRGPGLIGSYSVVRALPGGKIIAGGFAQTLLSADEYIYPVPALVRYNDDGTLDTSFGDHGNARVLPNVYDAGSLSDLTDVLPLADGKLLVLAYGYRNVYSDGADNSDLYVARLLPDGQIDSSFGIGGATWIDFGGSDSASGLAVEADGSIVVAGMSYTQDFSSDRVALAKLTSAGLPDTSFGKGGRALQSIAGTTVNVAAISLDVSGRPLLLIGVTGNAINATSILARYTPGGAPDTSYGQGKNYVMAAPIGVGLTDMRLNADGSMLVAGTQRLGSADAPGALYAARFTADGHADLSFGDGGSTTVPLSGVVTSGGLAVQSDGKIVLAGSTAPFQDVSLDFGTGSVVVARLGSDGHLDGSYGNDGVVLTLEGGVPSINAVAIDAHDRAILAGGFGPADWFASDSDQFPIIQRYLSSAVGGSISGTFYSDTNQNGKRDAGEGPLVGWTAYVDSNLSGLIDAGEPSAVTGSDGSYTINGLEPGPYRMREVRQDGWTRTQPAGVYPLGYYDVSLPEGQGLISKDFGNFRPAVVGSPSPTPSPTPTPTPTGTLSGTVLSAPSTVVAGAKTSIQITVRVNNSSDHAVAGPVNVKLYLSSDSTVQSSDALMSSIVKKLSLAPGASKVLKLKVRSIPVIHGATYFLLAQVTDPGQVTNVTAGPAVAVAAPFVDLALSFANPSAVSLARGARSTVSLLITNLGNIDAKGAATIVLRVTPAEGSAAARDMATSTIKLRLKRGAGKTYRVKFVIAADMAGGDYQLTATLAAPSLNEHDLGNDSAIAGPFAVI